MVASISLCITAISGVYVYFTKYSRKAKIGNKNRQNIEQIRIGMDKDRVTKIMGDADTIYFVKNINSQFFNKKVFSYYRGPGIYGYLQIIIDTEADTVIKILNIQE